MNPHEQIHEIISLDALRNDVAVLTCLAPLPPGARLCFETAGVMVHAKVVGIKKCGDHYQLTVRTASLGRADRRKLVIHLEKQGAVEQ